MNTELDAARARTVENASRIVDAATDVAHLVDIVRRAAASRDDERHRWHAINANTTYAEVTIDLALAAIKARSFAVWSGIRSELAHRERVVRAAREVNRAVDAATVPSAPGWNAS